MCKTNGMASTGAGIRGLNLWLNCSKRDQRPQWDNQWKRPQPLLIKRSSLRSTNLSKHNLQTGLIRLLLLRRQLLVVMLNLFGSLQHLPSEISIKRRGLSSINKKPRMIKLLPNQYLPDHPLDWVKLKLTQQGSSRPSNSALVLPFLWS
jgi:hypothetical protein